MGLDWMLHAQRPKTGCTPEYLRIKDKLNALAGDENVTDEQRKTLQKDLKSALEQVSVSPFTVIGAPQVGIDAEATAWLRKEVYEPVQVRVAEEMGKTAPRDPAKPQWNDRNDAFIAYWSRPFDQVLQDEHGKYVVELAKEPDGVAAITGMLCSSLDFRGKAVALSVVVDEDLRNEAFDDHDANACLDYAERLVASLHAYKEEHPDWQTRNESNDWGGTASPKDDASDIEAAVNWLRYWGQRGFGYSAWY